MGFESFQVQLRGGAAKFSDVDEFFRRHPAARPGNGFTPSPTNTYHEVVSPSYVAEVEVSDAPVRVSCRITLCHPPAAHRPFLDFVGDLMTRFGLTADILESVPSGATEFAPSSVAGFIEAALPVLSVRRAEWVAEFGPETMRATGPEVFERFILPHCEPATRWPRVDAHPTAVPTRMS